jgi:hypothetical protein
VCVCACVSLHVQGGYQSSRVITLLLSYITQVCACVCVCVFLCVCVCVCACTAYCALFLFPLLCCIGVPVPRSERCSALATGAQASYLPRCFAAVPGCLPAAQALAYSHTWKVLKPHVGQMLLQ